jgi:photosystem II stability/assembly factor-like uncharacterized protein
MDLKDSTAVIAGYSGAFYISHDSGNTWQAKNSGTSDYFQFVDVVSSDTIFLANTTGKILRTYNGGDSWQSLTCDQQISSIEFINSKVGYVGVTSNYILKTTDGGATWKQNVTVNFYPSNTMTIKFLDINTGFAFREHSDLLSTTDGGATWKTYDIGDDIYAFHFISKKIGFAAGEHGIMYKTNDGGLTWTWMSPDGRIEAYDLHSIYFLNSTTGFAVGARGRILKTTDGGATWKTYSPTHIDVSDLALASPTTAYATAGGSIFKTIDSGKNWRPLSFIIGTTYPNLGSFEKAYFFSPDTGFVAAGNQARIYKTYDGGTTWSQMYVTQYGYDHITDVQFLNRNTGFLAVYSFDQGTIVKTIDQGKTWKQIWTGQYHGETFKKIYFVDEKTGYAARYNQLYKTTDSAKTWTLLWQDELITDIWFTDAKTGFVCGENGMLKRTNDRGKTWTSIAITDQYYNEIFAIKFIDPQVGYLTAQGGSIYKSIDSGLTWESQGQSSFYQLRTIEFGSDSSVYLAGQYGSILRSNAREYRIDSFRIDYTTECSSNFQATVTAVLSTVDSIKFEYGINSFDKAINAAPFSVASQQQQVEATVTNLSPSTTYKVRLKLFSKGNYYYSSEYNFRSSDPPVTPTIVITGSTTICNGDSALLNSSASTGNQWFLNGTALEDATAPMYAAKQSGNYQLVSTTSCFTSDTVSVLVTVLPTPPAPVITLNGNLLTSSSNTGNQWYLDGIAIPGATTSEYRPTTSGNYSVQVTQNDCTSAFSAVFTFTITSINSPELVQKMTIGPNPVARQLKIYYSGNSSKLTVTLFDVYGRPVYRQIFSKWIEIDMLSFTSGLYILDIRNERTKEQMKMKVIKN